MPATAPVLVVPHKKLTFGNFRAHAGCPRRGFPGGQVSFVRAALTHKVTCALNGRGTGKSVGLEILFWEEARQTKGVYTSVYVAQGHPQAEKTFERFVKLTEKAHILTDRKNKGQDRWARTRQFGLNSGTERHFLSGEPGALGNTRGIRANDVSVDEAGWVHKSVLTTCVPMLATRNGKFRAVGTASRAGCGTAWFSDLFQRGVVGSEEKEEGYVSFNFPIESNPHMSDEDVAFQRSLFRDPNNPGLKTSEEAEECDGAFISDLGACFRNLDACISLPFARTEPGTYAAIDATGAVIGPVHGRRYVIGADWGLKNDRTVFSVFDRESHDQVALRVEPINRSYDEYVSHLDALHKRWNDALIIADSRDAAGYAQKRLTEKYGTRYKGIALTATGENAKGTHVARMKDLFDLTTWRFLKVPQQQAEFAEFAQIPIGEQGNGFRYSAPSGKHDDIVTAALFASVVMQLKPRRVAPPPKVIPAFSGAWYLARQKDRRRAMSRRSAW